MSSLHVIDVDSEQPEEGKNGLAQLAMSIINLLHELMEKQAIRRMEDGNLSDDQIERLGLTLMRQSEEIERMRKEFGLSKDDLELKLPGLINLED